MPHDEEKLIRLFNGYLTHNQKTLAKPSKRHSVKSYEFTFNRLIPDPINEIGYLSDQLVVK